MSLLGAFALSLGLASGAGLVEPAPAAADSCYTWGQTLSRGDSGSDVRELQVRVAGWAASGDPVNIDGVYGPETANAVERFQRGYGLSVDGVAGSETYGQIYALQDGDCTPAHFAFSEFTSGDGSGFSGGNTSASNVRTNVLRNMWKLEAMRHKLGDSPLYVSSGFRSVAHNDAVGGAPNSKHTYGSGVDLTGAHSLCDLARAARSSGFNGIIGPGASGHNDHTHLATRSGRYWNAPDCF
ncbi:MULTISPECIES: D-Ala-D-Ala carboxypeptidase family metallohydrolase [unclassified Actinopolyspora]|uniref:D-Ala-D-Ala carboxypeptidase family metallohydrolase n=1 Tax=unclassified Actinopolyspora TaxID=2639451 RepID=UPI0013F60FEF|nr:MULTISPECIES: D-Ala-D-Ala carboxypeptidase family metallohydrolase [unclassified Actinopolyspora]NHD16667.1 peptidase M15 [Actinopolyspora sp. BKK2]NHE75470.1 peptidase M15 [Actinopolyspora sp. BKK1]